MNISNQEISEKCLSDKSLKLAVRDVCEVGFVALEGVLSGEWCEMMREAWEGNIEGSHNKDTLKMPFIDSMAISNPWGVQIMEQIIGEDFWGILPYHTNSTAPNWEKTQEIHRDQPHLFSELPYALPPHMLIIHIPLIDFTVENGSTEVWPGTHLFTDPDKSTTRLGGGKEGAMEERASHMPSVRTNIPAGTVIVRDMRVWHRAMPNNTGTRRTMLSLVYYRYMPIIPPSRMKIRSISQETYDLLSERARRIYRFNNVEE